MATKKEVTMKISVQNVMGFIKTVMSGYVAQCAKIGITKNVSTSDCLYFSKISLNVPCTSDQPEQFSIHDFIQ